LQIVSLESRGKKLDKISTNAGDQKTPLTIPSSVLVGVASPFSLLEGSCRCVAGGEHLLLTTKVMIPHSGTWAKEFGNYHAMILGCKVKNTLTIPGTGWTYTTIGVEPGNK